MEIVLSFHSTEKARIIYDSVIWELDFPEQRGKLYLYRKRDKLIIEIPEYRDLTSLRAMINACLRSIYLSWKTMEVLEREGVKKRGTE